MKTAAVLLALALGACSTVTDTSHDHADNVYPADCPPSIVDDPALTSRVDIVRVHVSGAYGTTRKIGDRFLVTLDPSLSGWMLASVTRHEFAHVKRWIETGNPDWHARHVPNVYRPPGCADTFHCN